MAMQESSISVEELSLSSLESTLSRKDSYRNEHKKYRKEKKRLSLEHQSSLEDSTLAVHANWLMIRGLVKKWTKLWCVLKPGMLLLYKTKEAKSSQWVGTVLLNYCKLMERPSKMEGYCFTLFHPYEESIWAKRGPDGKTKKSLLRLLPSTQLVLNVPSESERNTWMQALGKAIHSPSLMGSTLSLLSLSGIREGCKEDKDEHSNYQDLNHTSQNYASNQEQESGIFATEFEEESFLWVKEDNLEDPEDTSSDESSYTSSEDGEELGAKKKEKPKKYVSSVVQRWESLKTQKDNLVESWETFKTQKEESWESFKTQKGNLVERVRPHIKPKKHSYTVTQEEQKKKKVYIMNFIKFPPRVINQYGTQLNLDLRKGATKDSKNLRITFEKLGYEVFLHENMCMEQTNDLLDYIEQDKTLEFVLLFVLSHGIGEDTFFCQMVHSTVCGKYNTDLRTKNDHICEESLK